MNTKQGYAFEVLRGANNFLAQYAHKLPGVTATGMYRRLEALVADLSAQVAVQQDNILLAKMATQTLASRRSALHRDHLAPIVSIARLHLEETPELAAFRKPKKTLPVEQLVSEAHAMSAAARIHAAVFIAEGCSPTFADELDQAADDVVEAKEERLRCRTAAEGATSGIQKLLSEGRRLIAVLDIFVRRASMGNAMLIAGWSAVSQMPRLASTDGAFTGRYDPRRAIARGAADAPRLAERSGEGEEYRATPIIGRARVMSEEEAGGRVEALASADSAAPTAPAADGG